MGTDAERINTLRDCLQDVYYYGHQLDLLAKAVAGQTRTHGRPPAKAFAAPDDALGAWPHILREVDSTLTDWWAARDAAIEAIEAVDDLSGHLFYEPDDPLLDRWTKKLRSWLVNLPGEWLRGTYTKRYGADAGKFLNAPMPADWMDNLAAHVNEWDRDLNAVAAVGDDLAAVAEEGKGARAATGDKSATTNARMIDKMQADASSLAWTSKQWAEHLGRSASGIVETRAWKGLAEAKALAKAQRQIDADKKTGLQSTTGKRRGRTGRHIH